MSFFDGVGENELRAMANQRKGTDAVDLDNDPH